MKYEIDGESIGLMAMMQRNKNDSPLSHKLSAFGYKLSSTSQHMKRKICIITGTRAEYGLLYWLMREIQEDADLELQTIATGMHLSPEFRLTYRQIEKDGFKIDRKIEMLLSLDTPIGISKSMGLGMIDKERTVKVSAIRSEGNNVPHSVRDKG